MEKLGSMRRSPLALLALSALWLGGCNEARFPQGQIQDRGQLLFNGYEKPDVECFKCHGGDASGGMKGPNLGKRVPGLSDEQIRQAILKGPGIMPSFEGKLDDRDIKDITSWLRGRFPSP